MQDNLHIKYPSNFAPENLFNTNKKLQKFYSKLGFEENIGINLDYNEINEKLYPNTIY